MGLVTMGEIDGARRALNAAIERWREVARRSTWDRSLTSMEQAAAFTEREAAESTVSRLLARRHAQLDVLARMAPDMFEAALRCSYDIPPEPRFGILASLMTAIRAEVECV